MGYETISTLSPRQDVPPLRDWTNVGREYTEPFRAEIETQIDGLEWTSDPSAPMMPGLGIKACVEELKIPVGPKPLYATNGYLEVPDGGERAAYSIYGIEGRYSNARVRVYVLDKGSALVPLCMDVWPKAAHERVVRPPSGSLLADDLRECGWDVIDGQIAVQAGNRLFAVVKGRRWTRVHEYLSNGQLTARWFVDEATGEAREAEGARKPRSWRMGGAGAEFARSIVELAR